MTLAIFDLDNTLLGGDSDHSWGDFLIGKGLVDATQHKARNDQFYHQYLHGGLNMVDYVEFAVGPVKGMPRATREALHRDFMAEFIEPMILPAAVQLLKSHRDKGDFCLIITATNRFITEPIAQRLGVDALIATDLKMENDCYTGRVQGIANFQAGKVRNLEQWLNARTDSTSNSLTMADSVFYSDSFNDLPLLEKAATAIAVDPDQTLLKIARERGWDVISLRGQQF
jgi:HAD superfamily hydrolase (TIGR01490 family)